MRRINHTPEYRNLVDLLRLQNGRSVVDVRARVDEMPGLLREQIGPRGTLVCCAYADRPLSQLAEIEGVKATMAYPSSLPLPSTRFHGALLHNTDGMTSLARPLAELARVTVPGSRILVGFTDWQVDFPSADERQQEMIACLNVGPMQNGQQFIERVASTRRGYLNWAFDAYLLGSNRPEDAPRYDYDWRSLMREHLKRRQMYSATQIMGLIHALDGDDGVSVNVSRFLALGTSGR